jgi:hypothetical protein
MMNTLILVDSSLAEITYTLKLNQVLKWLVSYEQSHFDASDSGEASTPPLKYQKLYLPNRDNCNACVYLLIEGPV